MDIHHKQSLFLSRFQHLPAAQLQALPRETLAALLLTLLEQKQLLADKTLPIERILILSQQKAESLCHGIRFIFALSDRLSRRIPKISFEDTANIEGWVAACKTAMDSPIRSESYEPIRIKATPKKQSTLIVSSYDASKRKEARALVGSLILDSIISPQLATLFTNATSGNNLWLTGEALRAKLVEKLQSFATDDATKLATLFKQAASNSTAQEKIVAKKLEEDMSFASDSFASYKPKTMAEILAAKTKQAKQQKLESFTQELQALANEVEQETTRSGNLETCNEEQEQEEPESYEEIDFDSLSLPESEETNDESFLSADLESLDSPDSPMWSSIAFEDRETL